MKNDKYRLTHLAMLALGAILGICLQDVKSENERSPINRAFAIAQKQQIDIHLAAQSQDSNEYKELKDDLRTTMELLQTALDTDNRGMMAFTLACFGSRYFHYSGPMLQKTPTLLYKRFFKLIRQNKNKWVAEIKNVKKSSYDIVHSTKLATNNDFLLVVDGDEVVRTELNDGRGIILYFDEVFLSIDLEKQSAFWFYPETHEKAFQELLRDDKKGDLEDIEENETRKKRER